MRKPFLLTLAALLLPIGGAARADQLLGQGRIDGAGQVLLPGGPTLGRWQGNKYTATPDALSIVGAGSGGDLSVASKSGYWLRNTPAASPVANFVRLNDRIIIGKDAQSWNGAYDGSGTDFAWTMGKGIYGYLPRNAMVWAANPYGTIGGLFSSRTGDSGKLPGIAGSGCCAIPVATLLYNDNTSVVQPGWNYYAAAVRMPGAGDTLNAEFDVINIGNLVRLPVYGNNPTGITVGFYANAGGEGAAYNNPSNPPFPSYNASSAAYAVGGNGTTFDKGIVVKSASVSPTGDGATVGLDLPANYLVRWPFDASDVTGGYVTSSVSGAATQMGLELSDYGALFKNRAGTIYGQINLVPNAVNRPLLSPSIAGQPVEIAALGADANIDINLVPKGTGRAIAPALAATVAMSPPTYIAVALPPDAPAGSIAYCSDCREPGQAHGAGTGMLVFRNATRWRSSAGGAVLN